MEHRVCYRCLIRELMAAEDYHTKIGQYIEKIVASARTCEGEYEKRLSVCKKCGKLSEGTCLACGCYVELRAATKTATCPHQKW